MLGFIASIFTLIQSFFLTVKSIIVYLPTVFSFMYDMGDFVSDYFDIYLSELESPIIILGYIFLQLVVVRILLQLL